MQNKCHQFTAHYIQQKYKLPKLIAKKISQVTLINHNKNNPPSQISHKKYSHKQYLDHCTWKTKQKQKYPNTQQKDVDFIQNLIILKKLKKFQPTNGSHSQYYKQKLSLNQNLKSQQHTNIINHLSPKTYKYYLPLKNIHLKKYTKLQHDKHNLLPTQQSLRKLTSQPKYISKLNQIKQTSDLLRKTTTNLAKKAQNIVIVNSHRFQQLQNQSKRILSGDQFTIEQQLSKDYHRNQYSQPVRWKSSKKVVIL